MTSSDAARRCTDEGGIEDPLAMLRRDAAPGVADGEERTTALVHTGGDPDLVFFLGIPRRDRLRRIDDRVEAHLTELGFAHVHGWDLAVHPEKPGPMAEVGHLERAIEDVRERDLRGDRRIAPAEEPEGARSPS